MHITRRNAITIRLSDDELKMLKHLTGVLRVSEKHTAAICIDATYRMYANVLAQAAADKKEEVEPEYTVGTYADAKEGEELLKPIENFSGGIST